MFEAIKCKETGELRSSTIDLDLSRDEIKNMTKLNKYAIVFSEHYPIELEVVTGVERANRPRRIIKTLLQ